MRNLFYYILYHNALPTPIYWSSANRFFYIKFGEIRMSKMRGMNGNEFARILHRVTPSESTLAIVYKNKHTGEVTADLFMWNHETDTYESKGSRILGIL